MDVYKTEEEQVEAIKKWWHENGKSIIAGVVLGITAIFGWRAYDSHTALQAEAASTLYEQMLGASRENDTENTRVYANRILEDYKSGTYAVFAKLMLAKVDAEAGNLDQAEQDLRWVLQKNSQPEIEHIARLRLVRVLIAANKLEQAMETLNIGKPGDFLASYEELRGDIYAKQGKPEEARKAYEKSLFNTPPSGEAQSLLEMKLDNLGRS